MDIKSKASTSSIFNSDEVKHRDTIDTIPDAKFYSSSHLRNKGVSWPNEKGQNATNIKSEPTIESPGPNINLKLPKRRYNSSEERKFFFDKIKVKQKTELCKNYALYNDCYFKDNCSFAHGSQELRQTNTSTVKYKTKPCRMFNELMSCNYGKRCYYLHLIREGRFLKYTFVLNKFVNESQIEMNKKENKNKELWSVHQLIHARKQYVIPRLKVFENIISSSP